METHCHNSAHYKKESVSWKDRRMKACGIFSEVLGNVRADWLNSSGNALFSDEEYYNR
mgnify:CR=1 FL=1